MVSEHRACSIMVILDKSERSLVGDYIETLDETSKRLTKAFINACTSNTFSTGEYVATWSSTKWTDTAKSLIDHISKYAHTARYKVMVKDILNNKVIVSRGDFEESYVPEKCIEEFIT